MASLEEFSRVSFVKGTSDEERHVIDHVAICQVVHEFGQGARRIGLQVSEFGYELLGSLIGEGGGGRVWREGVEVIAIGGTELELDILGEECK